MPPYSFSESTKYWKARIFSMADVELSSLGSVIKTAYEGEANTNAFTDAEKAKLTGIDAGAEVNPTAGEIKTAYESNANTNAFTDAEQTKLAGISAGAEVNTVEKVGTPANNQVGVWTGDGTIEGATALTWDNTTLAVTGNVTVTGTVDGRDLSVDGSKLDGIEAGAERATPAIVSVASSRALLLTDVRDILEIDTTAGAVAVTIPTNASVAIPIGSVINMTLLNTTNAATLVAAGGVTLNGVSAGSGTITATPYSVISMYKRTADAWVVSGNIGAIA